MFVNAWLRIAVGLLALAVTARVWAADPATLDAPASVAAGSEIRVIWTGPGRKWDRIGIVPADAPDKGPDAPQSTYAQGSAVTITAPDEPGAYEVRYFSYEPKAVLARRKVTVLLVTATIEGPAHAISGASVDVKWTGPANRYDRIQVVKAGAPEKTSSNFSVPAGPRSPARVTVPEAPGDYEFRYITGQSKRTLARALVNVTATTASLEGPGTATAGSYFKVNWKGPGNDYDYITISQKGSNEDQWLQSVSVNHHSPTSLRAPVATGEYELRYHTGQTHATLAHADLRVTPAKQPPGSVRVTATHGSLSGAGAVEIILDASGSMLQRIGSERRIDIAKQTLKNLISNVIPAGTPFALRVFGREPSSCQTDLDIPASPLDRAAVASKVDALTAKSNAKTPIAASLERIEDDLRNVSGQRLVILVTDGEETCGGDPALTIQKLMKRGIDVRINIVGFAVGDRKTAARFRQWSTAGGGAYFDAQSAASLNEAFSQALKPRFEIVDAQKRLVADGLVGGEPASVLPGEYTVRLKGATGRSLSVTVRSNKSVDVSF